MRLVVQRVAEASVTVDERVVARIGRGLCALVGLHKDDCGADLDYAARKLVNVRLFDCDRTGRRWAQCARDLRLPILCVSQFTLYAVLKGNKPDFHSAMGADRAPQMYEQFLDTLRRLHAEPQLVFDGRFGAHMRVHIHNDGPVTIDIDSRLSVTDADRRRLDKWRRTRGAGAAASSDADPADDGAAAAAANDDDDDDGPGGVLEGDAEGSAGGAAR